jgi:hypothetical protein
MKNVTEINKAKQQVLSALVEKGVFDVDDNPRVTKFQGGKFHLKSVKDSGKAEIKNGVIIFDTVIYGAGETSIIENRNSENPEVKELVNKFGIDTTKMERTIFVFDRESGEVKEFQMHKNFGEMNNGIKAMQVQRIKNHANVDDLILNTNLDRFIK